MRSRVALAMLPAVLLVSAPAAAHFKLNAPASATTQDAEGDPQKPANLQDGCPAGTATGVATQVRAGSTLRVSITETVAHGGHYRVSFGANEAAFQYPATVVQNDSCISNTIATNPQLPVLVDGLFAHDQNAANLKNFCNGTATCETNVTIPNVAPGNYVLQVIEWMVPHSSAINNGAHGCYYAHCANLQVVAPDAGVGDGGVVVIDSGVPTTDSGTVTPPSDGGGTGNRDASAGGDSGDDGNNGVRPPRFADTSSGCSTSSGSGNAGLAIPFLVALGALGAILRRRRR